MTTVAQTMLTDAGANWTGSVRFTQWMRIGDMTGDDHAPITATVTAGVLSQSLRGAAYYKVEVGANTPYLILIASTGTISLDDARVSGVTDPLSFDQWFDDPDAVAAVTVASRIETIFLIEDGNTPPARGVLFRREATVEPANGVTVVEDGDGATFVRYSP